MYLDICIVKDFRDMRTLLGHRLEQLVKWFSSGTVETLARFVCVDLCECVYVFDEHIKMRCAEVIKINANALKRDQNWILLTCALSHDIHGL